MSTPEIEEIKSKLNIVDVVSEYVQLKKAGVNYKVRCPFHQEKTPSFMVNPARQIWYCFGCNQGGDVITFVQKIESLTFPEALSRLADRVGVILKPLSEPARQQKHQEDQRREVLIKLNELAAAYYHQVLLRSAQAMEARQYLQTRKFNEQTITHWGIGYAPPQWDALGAFLRKRGFTDADIQAAGLASRSDKGTMFDRFRDRITFPITDLAGHRVGFSARILHSKEGVGKYINSPESPIYSKSKILFGLYQARNDIRRSGAAVVVEGNIDAIKSWQAGVTNAVASSGTAFTDEQLTLLKRFADTLIFAFDADAAGQQATRRALAGALGVGFQVRLIRLPADLKDPDEVVDQNPQLWKDLVKEASDYLDFYFHHLFDILDPSDAQAKKRAVADFLSLLQYVADPVVVAHYVHLVSQAISVRDQLIMQLLVRPRTGVSLRRPTVAATAPAMRNSGELAEERLVGLLFLLSPRLQELLPSDLPPLQFEPYRGIVNSIQSMLGSGVQCDRTAFVALYPHYATVVDMALFHVEQRVFSDPAEELRTMLHVRRLEHLRGQLAILGRQIARAEQEGKVEEQRAFARYYARLASQIQEVELTFTRVYGKAKEGV